MNILDAEEDEGNQICSLQVASQESFAMTYRESKEQINSNDLFETIQENIDRFCNNQLVINSNEYVSFKQLSTKKPSAMKDNSNRKP